MLTFSNECLEFALNCIAIRYGRIQSHWHPMHAGSGRHPQASFWSLATLQSLEAATSRTWSKRATSFSTVVLPTPPAPWTPSAASQSPRKRSASFGSALQLLEVAEQRRRRVRRGQRGVKDSVGRY